MKDRELLELASMAAGLEGYIHEWINGPEFIIPGENPVTWNPLQDDGDAQRLRNKLRMDVFYTDQGVNVAHDDVLLAFEPWGTNDIATERRATTRAAAYIAIRETTRNDI